MDVTRLSAGFGVRILSEGDIDAIYALAITNPLFYRYCPPFVTREGIGKDLRALPPGRGEEDKFFVGFFRGEKLIAILDLILGFPDRETAYLGLFMVHGREQGRGIGSALMEDCAAYLKSLGYCRMRLAFAKGNPQSEAFWGKNGFVRAGGERRQEDYTAVPMERKLTE